MKRRAVLTLLCLTACAQQNASSLEPQTGGGVETMPADSLSAPTRLQRPPFELQRELPAVPGVNTPWETTGVAIPMKPVKAVGALVFDPPSAVTVTDVRRITASYDVTNGVPGTNAAIEWVSPSGQPFHRDELPVGVAAPADDHLSFELPVAATIIDSQKLSGIWTAQLLVGGEVVTSQTFELSR